MSEPEEKVFEGDDGVELRRMPNPGKMPVLLLHGGGARHGTFLIPTRGMGREPRGLADWLLDHGFEPWLLDWRAGATVVEKAKKPAVRRRFDLDHAAKLDIPFALNTIRDERPDAKQIGAVGHCLGAGALAQAIASADEQGRLPLTHVVLLTLGLFYETPLESRLKAQDRALERVWRAHPDVDRIDPCLDGGWPAELEGMYQSWPRGLHAHPEEKPSAVCEICNRASFMYGTPYLETQLVPEIHNDTWALSFEGGENAPLPGELVKTERSKTQGTLYEITLDSDSWGKEDAAGVLWLIDEGGEFEAKDKLMVGERVIGSCTRARHEKAQLPLQFGAIPLRMFVQAARNVRRRWATRFAGSEDESLREPEDEVSLVDESRREHFDGLSVTLLTGAKNQLWSPDSIHRMYEWLIRGTKRPGDACRKVILKDYGHQDLLWGRFAHRDVFPEIGAGLGLKREKEEDESSR